MLLAAVCITNYACVTYIKRQQKQDAYVVDVAGRNRMLSQKIGFYAERIARGQADAIPTLKAAINLHHALLQTLKHGGVVPDSDNSPAILPADAAITPTIRTTMSQWQRYRQAAEEVLLSAATSSSSATTGSALRLLEEQAPLMLAQNNLLVKAYVQANQRKQAQLQYLLIALLMVNLMLIMVTVLMVRHYIIRPLHLIQSAAERLARGNLTETTDYPYQDEVGQTIQHINHLTQRLIEAASFAERVGHGSLSADLPSTSDHDVLRVSLLHMQEQLRATAAADEHRRFVSDGLAQLGALLRNEQDDLKQMAQQVLSFTVKYLRANQGGLYIVTDDLDTSACLVAAATYAWNKEKYVEQRIRPGQGLVGQVWLERKTTYLRVPSDYVRITSGLGEATPRNLIVAPLMYNNEVAGVLELAAFQPYAEHEIAFVEQAAESIALTLTRTQSSEHMKRLLEEAQQQAETMRATEEEMRQNMEELSATQEEMQRKEQAYLERINSLEQQPPTRQDDERA